MNRTIDEECEGGGEAGDRFQRPKFKTITDVQKEIFLEALTDGCNVRRAAAAAGFAYSAAYRMRRDNPDFAEAWQGALESGYARLEMALVERAILTIEIARDGNGADAVPVIGAMTVDQAIELMNKHRASVEGGQAKRIRLNRNTRPTAEETDAEILRRIAIIERQRGGAAKGEP
ncbi:hypothetical protein [Sphingopyxis panaciterrae]